MPDLGINPSAAQNVAVNKQLDAHPPTPPAAERATFPKDAFVGNSVLAGTLTDAERFEAEQIAPAVDAFREIAEFMSDNITGRSVAGKFFDDRFMDNPYDSASAFGAIPDLYNLAVGAVGAVFVFGEMAFRGTEICKNHLRTDDVAEIAARKAAAGPVEEAVIAAVCQFWVTTEMFGKPQKNLVAEDAMPALSALAQELSPAAEQYKESARVLVETSYMTLPGHYVRAYDQADGGYLSGPTMDRFSPDQSMTSVDSITERLKYRYSIQ